MTRDIFDFDERALIESEVMFRMSVISRAVIYRTTSSTFASLTEISTRKAIGDCAPGSDRATSRDTEKFLVAFLLASPGDTVGGRAARVDEDIALSLLPGNRRSPRVQGPRQVFFRRSRPQLFPQSRVARAVKFSPALTSGFLILPRQVRITCPRCVSNVFRWKRFPSNRRHNSRDFCSGPNIERELRTLESFSVIFVTVTRDLSPNRNRAAYPDGG